MKTQKIAGIVADEYTFPKGCYQVAKIAHDITRCDVLVAIIPGAFSTSGEPIGVDKWQRTTNILDSGADLVIELPFGVALQGINRSIQAAIELLSLAQATTIVVLSETNNLAELKQIADLPIKVDALKLRMDACATYPSSYGLVAGAYYPHDIAAIAAIRAMRINDIEPLVYPSIECAGTGLINTFNFADWSLYYPFLRWKIQTLDHVSLSEVFLYDEGIEHHFAKYIGSCDTWDAFLKECITRRYTKQRIQRVCTQLMVHTQKAEIDRIKPLNTLRILGFNDVGRAYLKVLKAKKVKIASRFNQIPQTLRELEYRATMAYVTPLPIERRSAILRREMGGPVIKKAKVSDEKCT